MKEQINNICSNCGNDNPLFEKNCRNCKYYLRTAVSNIDLWSTIWQLFESPQKALLKIIYAEHKNFVTFISILIAIKLFLLAVIFQSSLNFLSNDSLYPKSNLFIQLGIYLCTILIFIRIKTTIINKKQITRYKDNLAIFTYSLIPIVLSLIILTPVEYGIFGIHWFIYNPSPFIIKEFVAYLLFFIEGLMLVWSIFLYFYSCYIQSKSKTTALAFTLFLIIILLVEMYTIPFIIL